MITLKVAGLIIAGFVGTATVGTVAYNYYTPEEQNENIIEVGNNIPDGYYDTKIEEKKPEKKQKPIVKDKPKKDKPLQPNTEKQKVEAKKELKFKTIEQEVKNPEEEKRLSIIRSLATESFESSSNLALKDDYEMPKDYEPKKPKEIDPFIRSENFGLKSNEASGRVDLTKTILESQMIPVLLVTAINSHLKGDVVAKVERDIYAEHGRNILIPMQSEIIGKYLPLKKLGDERLAITWYRIITPAGVNINLKANSYDVTGRSGAIGELDNRYLDRYGLALTVSTVSAAVSYAAAKSSSSTDGAYSAEDLARNQIVEDYKNDITTITEEILKDTIKILPSINIDAGARLYVKPIADIWFSQAENNNIDVRLVKPLQSKKDRK